MKQLITLLFFSSIYLSTFAQNDSASKSNVFGFFITIPLEFPHIDNKALNNELNTLGYPKCDYSKVIPGIGFQTHSERIIFSYAFNKHTKKDVHDNYSTEVAYTAQSLNIGFDVIKNYRYSLYPYVGYKNCKLNYLYKGKIDTTITFQNYFKNVLGYKEITNNRSHVDMGIGASLQKNNSIAIRLGYLYALDKLKWKVNKHALSNAPALNYMYYFTITIGLGSIEKTGIYRNRNVEVTEATNI